ncbi:MAG: OmpA family protein [Pseudomonadota bacterium]
MKHNVKLSLAAIAFAFAITGCSTGPKHEAPPPAAPPAETITITTDGLFDFDSAVIKPELAAKLDEVAARISGRDYSSVSVVGHTCNIGSDAYNQGLSERRAQSAGDYLAGKGVDVSRMGTSGEGESNPAYSNDTQAGRKKNRRVEVSVN